ncbi:transketolase [candidate division WWE3 bacterium]|uniref:Transketolase n=1 Tax=candidate division WWE3 bacterium TaxID=2053526 RepID=A0A955RPV9_UNCKA|nr:transketolase [candidate division WWE3 bacterium]
MPEKNLLELEKKANQIRVDIIRSLVEAGSGHSAGPLDMADVFTAIYFGDVMKYDPKNPDWEERDRFILSNGHICPLLYATLAHAGFFPREELLSLRKLDSRLQGHPHRVALPGLETSSGPLGMGLSQAAGMAYSFLMDKKKNWVFAALSDGEHQEGNTWEAILFAGKYKLYNLTVLIDRNNIQIDGYTENVMPLESMVEKYESFNWHVQEIDGHNIESIIDAINESKAISTKPSVIICNTIPGKGVEYMERDYEWHGKPPGTKGNVGEVVEALYELRTLGGQIASEHE